MGDALRMGRTLGEALAPVLDDPLETDRALRRWEHETARHCLHAYHFANSETIVDEVSPVFREFVKDLARLPGPSLSHIFGRTRHTQELLTWPRMFKALVHGGAQGPGPLAAFRFGLETAASSAASVRDRGGPLPRARPVPGSDHPGFEPWAAAEDGRGPASAERESRPPAEAEAA